MSNYKYDSIKESFTDYLNKNYKKSGRRCVTYFYRDLIRKKGATEELPTTSALYNWYYNYVKGLNGKR